MAASTAASSDYKGFLIDKSNVKFGDVIGRGGFSQVWRVHVKDTVTGETRKAAAKKVRNNETIEVQVMESLDHPNVVTFYGILMDTPDTYIIMELAENGDLRRYLDAWREKEKSRLPIRLVWKWIFEAAQGIHYLHQKKHTHRDIKSLNYLIMDGLTIKLGDLGLAKEMDLTQETSGVRGTCRWMAPEVIKEQKRSIKSDIYSFGIVVWEVFTTAIPFEEIRGDFQVMNSVCNGARPTIPDDCPGPLRELIEVCWREDYKKRPDMAEVCDILQQNVQTQESCEELTKQLEGAAISAGSGDTPMELSQGLDTDNHKGQEETASSQEVFKLPSGGDVDMTSVSPYVSRQGVDSYTISDDTNTDTVAMYKMCHVPRGVCLIINNEDFSIARSTGQGRLFDREGSHVDLRKLDSIFKKFHFDVRPVTNRTTTEMYNALDNIRREDHKRYNAFVCCILTHGKLGELAGVHGKYLKIQEILSLFTAEKCPSLRGKPKIFFIQACQGLVSHEKLPIHEGAANIQQDAPPLMSGIGAALDKTIPNHSDFLLGFATVPGHVSYRNTVLGSWYISILVDKLERLHDKEDLMSILTEVNRKLSKESAKLEGGEFGQIPAPVSTLRKKVYFTTWVSTETPKK